LTAWCTNIGDALAVMLRPGNAGSFTAADHIALLTAAFAQIPAEWRTDVLVTIDGAGASHDVIDCLTSWNTAAAHGNRGRRVEYTIGWPVDERTQDGIEELRERDWGPAVHTDGALDPNGPGRGPDRDPATRPGRGPARDLADQHARPRRAHPAPGRQAGEAG
jgi:hypothetical protein